MTVSPTTQQLLDSAPDAVLIVDDSGLIQLVNCQAESLFGYASDELIGERTSLLVPERDRSSLERRRAECYRDPTVGPVLAAPALRKDGTEFLVDASFSLLDTDEGRCVYLSVRDSSERKTIEAGSQSFDITSQMAAIVESSDDAIIGKTLDGVITTWNAGAQQMYGFAPEEMLGHNVAELMPSDRVSELAPLFEQVRRGERIEHLETKRLHRDGSILDVSVSILPIRDADGVITGASTLARDLTAVKKAEVDRRDLEDRLRQSERLESLGQLAGGVAHDFNNLLAGVMNYAALVSDCLREEMDRRELSDDDAFMTMVQDVEEITKVAKRAAALTHQLLVFSRREVARKESLDLNTIVCEMETLLRTTIPENVELRMLLASDLPLVKADRSQVDQVFMNLAVNARDAMPDGGELEIETATFEVDEQYARVAAIEPGLYVRLTVSDTGTGMSREVLARTFEPFFTTKPKGVGTGLGLATVYGIVTQAGGDVTIYSEPGLGTAVRVNLPVTSDPASVPLTAPAEVPLWANGETVLLVEDEEIVREPTRRILTRHGYTVLAAGDAEEAMALVREHPGTIDLLLTDVVMPGRSGAQLAVEVLQHRPATRVLFMSGYSQDLMSHQGVLEEGVRAITKPFAADDLLHTVREALDGDS